MTLAPSDSPDWTGIPGSSRYLGRISVSGTGGIKTGSLAYTPASYDGAIMAVAIGQPNSSSQEATLVHSSTVGTFATDNASLYSGPVVRTGPFVFVTSLAVASSWTLTLNINNAVLASMFVDVFALPAYPVVRLAQGLSPITVQDRWTAARQPYDFQDQSSPALGVVATLTLPVNVGFHWVIDSWTVSLRNSAATQATHTFRLISSGGTTLFQDLLSIPATLGAVDRSIQGPGQGYRTPNNEGLTAEFTAAPAATVAQRLALGAYLVNNAT